MTEPRRTPDAENRTKRGNERSADDDSGRCVGEAEQARAAYLQGQPFEKQDAAADAAILNPRRPKAQHDNGHVDDHAVTE